MYTNLTFVTDGELTAQMGLKRAISNSAITLNSYNKMDELTLTATQNKVKFVIDLVDPERIVFDDFPIEENSLISTLLYNNTGGITAVISKKASSAAPRRDDGTLRFGDTIDGHIAAIHGMLRILFANIPPNETILGHAHNLFCTMLYSMIVMKIFNKDYGLSQRNDFTEDQQAAIRYGCACVTASKLFELSCSINDVAIPLTTFMFGRVRPSFYQTDNNITSYTALAEYISEKTLIKNISQADIVNGVLRQMGHRALVLLECGVDFLIDCLLCKSINNIIAHNLLKNMYGSNQFEYLQRKIVQAYYQQASLNIGRG